MSALVTIAPGHQLVAAPAASYARMRAAGCPAGITSSTRLVSVQWAYYVHQGEPGWPAKADHPDKSKHVHRPGTADEGGRALDVPADVAAWVRAHPEHGWRFTVAGEWWHIEYFAALDLMAHLPAPTPAAPPAPPAPVWEVDDMRDLIEALYRVGMGRTPAPDEASRWLVVAAEKAWTPAQLRAEFWRSRPEQGTVRAAFLEYLGREPGAAEIAAWVAAAPTIADVRAGVAQSPEAQD